MNKAIIIGRIVKKPELRKTPTNKFVTTFSLAVSRNKDDTDFIPCVAWEKTAELVSSTDKGSLIGVEGKLYTSNYEHKGEKRFKMEVLVDRIEFLSKKEVKEVEVPFPDEEPKKEEIIIDSEELPFY